MRLELTAEQKENQKHFRDFVDTHIAPHADHYDQEEALPAGLIQNLAQQRYLVATLPREAGGADMDMMTYGLLSEEIGRGCASVRNLLAVQGMVAHAISRWGTQAQKQQWLPRIGSGEAIGAFALTEPNIGSDAGSVETTATHSGNAYILSGHKKWISFGQSADVFLVFAQYQGAPAAFLVQRNTPGLSIKPTSGLLGLRASMLAELHLDACQIPQEQMVGKAGMGFSWVASFSLDYGRYSTACGCVGLAQACLDASLHYTHERRQFGTALKDHQLIQQMMTHMVANVAAARLLCYQAGYLRDASDPDAIRATLIAKYFASTLVPQIASNAVQIHGANGCSTDYPIQRYLRDAKIMEIIEGTTQIHELKVAELTK